MKTKLTHRRENDELGNHVILFAEDDENLHYGDHCWTLETELPQARDDEALIAYAMDYYGVDREEALDLVNPLSIVESAGAWDDEDFVSGWWQAIEGTDREVAGYRTNDGAVVIDRYAVEMTYSCDDDEEDDDE
jgi:hypothetical protein